MATPKKYKPSVLKPETIVALRRGFSDGGVDFGFLSKDEATLDEKEWVKTRLGEYFESLLVVLIRDLKGWNEHKSPKTAQEAKELGVLASSEDKFDITEKVWGQREEDVYWEEEAQVVNELVGAVRSRFMFVSEVAARCGDAEYFLQVGNLLKRPLGKLSFNVFPDELKGEPKTHLISLGYRSLKRRMERIPDKTELFEYIRDSCDSITEDDIYKAITNRGLPLKKKISGRVPKNGKG